MKLIDRIAPCLAGNPRQELIDCSAEAVDWQQNLYYLIGGTIAMHQKQPDALKKIKRDLQSSIFELQSVVNGIF
jgi:hypothetical protein